MESVALLGIFIGIAILGYFFVGKVDKLLNCIQEDNEKRKQTYHLRIAASDFYAAYSISNILSDIQEEYPHLQCTLSVGQDDELLECFDKHKADVIVVSSDIEYPEHPYKQITLEAHPVQINGQGVTLTPLTAGVQQRKVFWQNSKSHPLVSEFVKQLCQTQAHCHSFPRG